VGDASGLLDRYETLTGWSEAMLGAGVDVRVVQRFKTSERLKRNAIQYDFVADSGPPMPSESWNSEALVGAVHPELADVIHINGLMFPAAVASIRHASPRVVIVIQDHAGIDPPSGGVLDLWRRWHYRGGMKAVDAWSFTAAARAEPWREAGLLGDARVLEIVEASTHLRPMDRAEARRITGVHGDPAVLWVGRLDENKDPLTLLAALEIAIPRLQNPRCWMVFRNGPLEADVRARVATSPALRKCVTLVGEVPHAHLAAYYSAADIYVSASLSEGSGYALIEAMACGAVPVVTDIPSFAAIAGECGRRWRPEWAASCADGIIEIASGDLVTTQSSVRARFSQSLTWDAIGSKTADAYWQLVKDRASKKAEVPSTEPDLA
jgi:glycosyltransferase involved in cell wall biosynthesis